jgi:hypothetical protein
MEASSPKIKRCSFCERNQDEVERLIAGPNDIFICNYCVDLCHVLLDEERVVKQDVSNTVEQDVSNARDSIFSGSIFISYNSTDRNIVTELANDLQKLSCEVWFDQELKLRGGHEWWKVILKNVRECNLFLFALTPKSLKSHPCTLEYQYASALNKRILPVMLEDVDIRYLPIELQSLQVVDYRQKNKAIPLKSHR